MSEKATYILKEIYKAYDRGDSYTVNNPPSGEIHSFNMALNEIKPYIEFLSRDMLKISITLTDSGLEYCMENFD